MHYGLVADFQETTVWIERNTQTNLCCWAATRSPRARRDWILDFINFSFRSQNVPCIHTRYRYASMIENPLSRIKIYAAVHNQHRPTRRAWKPCVSTSFRSSSVVPTRLESHQNWSCLPIKAQYALDRIRCLMNPGTPGQPFEGLHRFQHYLIWAKRLVRC